jgi:hypothetical protein
VLGKGTVRESRHYELKDAWPFLWYENEYVVDAASTFILAPNAAEALTHSSPWIWFAPGEAFRIPRQTACVLLASKHIVAFNS